MIDFGVLAAQWTDFIRLVAVPVLAWAAFKDIKTRRVPNRTWLPLAGVAVLTLLWDGVQAWTAGGVTWTAWALPTVVSIGFVVPLAYGFWLIGGFGGADAKALMVLAVLFPTFPEYVLASGTTLPVQVTAAEAFAFTILTNTVLLGVAYPLLVAGRNATEGQFGLAMFVARRVHWTDIETTHGRLMETPDGLSRSGADLDTLRMYLRWRGASLADLREDPQTHRDPGSLPESPHPTTDGAVVTDGGETVDTTDDVGSAGDETDTDGFESYDDPWGAEAFCEAAQTTYGTSAEELRGALETIVSTDRVWVSPGIPFLVPMFFGLVAALLYGDLLFGLLGALGLAPTP